MKILIQNSKDERLIGLGQAIQKYLPSDEVKTFDKEIQLYPLLQEFNPDIIIFEEHEGLKDGDIEYAKQEATK